jgi:hypothetical protein
MQITLSNDFHNTRATMRVADCRRHIHNVLTVYPSASQLKRAKRSLCGMADCCCSGDAGIRGRQTLDDGTRIEINCDSLIGR